MDRSGRFSHGGCGDGSSRDDRVGAQSGNG